VCLVAAEPGPGRDQDVDEVLGGRQHGPCVVHLPASGAFEGGVDQRLTGSEVVHQHPGAGPGRRREATEGCPWQTVCEQVARDSVHEAVAMRRVNGARHAPSLSCNVGYIKGLPARPSVEQRRSRAARRVRPHLEARRHR
jgi:hypothetical protein